MSWRVAASSLSSPFMNLAAKASMFCERDLSDVGGARSQVFFDSRRQGQRRVLRRGRCGNAGRCQKQNCDSSLHVELSLLLPVTVVSRELNLDLIEGVVGDA